ncbi:MAG: nitronate monooxygenase family protein, partial [Myxococcota bacterium]
DLLAALPETVLAAIDVIIDEGASAFIAGLGVPRPVIERCHDAGLKVMSMCGKVSHAVAAEEAGCDVVVAQGTEAGGHTGQIGGIALIPQIVDAVDIPVLAAGALVDGRGLAAALSFGAQGVWMGTRFIASHEAHAAEMYKKKITEVSAAETRITRCYSGKTMRVIRNSYVDDWERRPHEIRPFPEQMENAAREGVLDFATGGEPDIERTCMPCGQGAGGILEIASCAEIIDGVMSDAREAISKLTKLAADCVRSRPRRLADARPARDPCRTGICSRASRVRVWVQGPRENDLPGFASVAGARVRNRKIVSLTRSLGANAYTPQRLL